MIRSMLTLLALVWLVPVPALAANPPTKADPGDVAQVQRGKKVYDIFCALCHGADLEGQADWRTRKPDGKLPAPPHDETGHTWHHSDEMLFGMIKQGMVPPYAPKEYPTDMPGWGSTLKDNDIWAVLAYIKSRWPEETHKLRREIGGGFQPIGKKESE